MSLAGINFPLVAHLHSALLSWIYYIIIIILNSQFYSLQFDEFQLLNAANLFNLWATQHNSKATEPTQPFINPPPRSALQIRASLVVLCCLFCRFISHPFPAPLLFTYDQGEDAVLWIGFSEQPISNRPVQSAVEATNPFPSPVPIALPALLGISFAHRMNDLTNERWEL